MPRGIMPMLAKPGAMPANDGDYGFEMKWDGIRAILYIDHGRARLVSRNLHRYHRAVPGGAVPGGGWRALPSWSWTGRSSPSERTARRPSAGSRTAWGLGALGGPAVRQLMATTPVTYMIFDVLYRDGASLMDRALHRAHGRSWPGCGSRARPGRPRTMRPATAPPCRGSAAGWDWRA